MQYKNANMLLPEALIKELQNYIQGGYLYVPASEEHRRWGEISGYRTELQRRNCRIRQEHRDGIAMEALADRYCLSVYTIRKIIYQK